MYLIEELLGIRLYWIEELFYLIILLGGFISFLLVIYSLFSFIKSLKEGQPLSSKKLWFFSIVSLVFVFLSFYLLAGCGTLLIESIFMLIPLCVVPVFGITTVFLNISQIKKEENKNLKILKLIVAVIFLLFFLLALNSYISAFSELCGIR